MDIVVDSCSVRAKHGGDLTGPNPTDRGKRGTKYHIVVSTEGLPLGAVAAKVSDTTMFPELLRLALVVGVAISRLLADAGYDSADNRWLCLRQGIRPVIRHKGVDHGSGLGAHRGERQRLAPQQQTPRSPPRPLRRRHPLPAHHRLHLCHRQ